MARILARYNLPSVAVVDDKGRLLGQITFDDVIDVVEAETTEDILKFGGVPASELLAAGWREAGAEPASVALRQPAHRVPRGRGGLRLPEHGAAHGRAGGVDADHRRDGRQRGHAGAGGHGAPARAGADAEHLFARVVGKEVLVGMVNGLAIGGVVGVVAMLMGDQSRLGAVVFLAMTGNLLVAGFAGGFIPVVLERYRIDPAIASSIFVTTFTDVCGFLLLLGLAGWLLL